MIIIQTQGALNYSLQQKEGSLDHLSQQLIDGLLPITSITTLDEMLEFPLSPPTGRITQLERPQKVVGLLEIWSNCENLMNQILDRFNAILSE
jgi:hypothetical protein